MPLLPDGSDARLTLSRRDLFRTAGLAAGGALMLGLPKFIGGWAGEAEAALSPPTTVSSLTLELNGLPAGFVFSAGGGHAFADTILEAPGPDGIQRKRPGPVRFEDIVIEVPLPLESNALSSWIGDTLAKAPTPKNGAIVYAAYDGNVVKRLEFTGGFLTEIGLPKLDISDQSTALLTLHITPQQTRLVGGSGKIPKSSTRKQALASHFRFSIQGLEQTASRIGLVEPITAKRPLSTAAMGQDKFAQTRPAVLDCSPVSLLVSEKDAGPFYAWFEDAVVKGKGGERGGVLELLSPTLNEVFATVQLGGLGIVRFAPEPVKSGTENIARVRVDMYCETMTVIA